MGRCPRRKGTAPLRALLDAEQGPQFQRSKAERLLKQLITDAELQPPLFNTYVLGYEVDAYWPAHQVVVEVDGYDAHGHREAFERDRRRDQDLVAAGYVVVRITWRQLTQRPTAVVARIAAALANRS
ncbi:MAG: endonuclease domain-containing protein [Solirubrobacteraceae bacterium]